MFKKIKSLLIAGLLVFGMCGNAFAAEYQWEHTSTVTNPVFNPPAQGGPGVPHNNYSFQNEAIKVGLYNSSKMSGYGEYAYNFQLNWDTSKFHVTKIVAYKEVNNDYSPVIVAENIDKNTNSINTTKEIGGDLLKFDIVYELADVDEDNIPDIKDNVLPGDEDVDDKIATGDANTMVMLGVGAVSAGAILVLVNRKKKDE